MPYGIIIPLLLIIGCSKLIQSATSRNDSYKSTYLMTIKLVNDDPGSSSFIPVVDASFVHTVISDGNQAFIHAVPTQEEPGELASSM